MGAIPAFLNPIHPRKLFLQTSALYAVEVEDFFLPLWGWQVSHRGNSIKKMFHYIDESGNTGNDLFEKQQPHLYYGVISSATNLDETIAEKIASARKLLGVNRLHASEIGISGIQKILPILKDLSQLAKSDFSFYTVAKRDLAIIMFFDQVFDPHLNAAVPWHHYWTPLRYLLLLKLSRHFDDKLAKLAWNARISKSESESRKGLIKVCYALQGKLTSERDARFKELVGGALKYAIKHPDSILYHAGSKQEAAQLSPNLIGFQYVLSGISRMREATSDQPTIVVDMQNEFNEDQNFLNAQYKKLSGFSGPVGIGLPEFNLQNMPDTDLVFKSGKDSPGLDLVDIQLWLTRKLLTGELPGELSNYIIAQIGDGHTDELSFKGIIQRWGPFFENGMPQIDEFPPEQMARGMELHRQAEARRLKVIESL